MLSYKRRVQPRNYSTRAKANALATQRNAMRIGSGRVGMDDAPMHQHASYGGSPGFQSSFSQSALARLRREEYLSPPGPRSPTSPTSGWQNSDGMYEQGGQPVLPTFSPLMQSQPIGAYPYRDEQSPSYSSSPVDTPSPHFHPQSRADPITSPLNYRLYSGSPLVAMNDTPYDLEQGSSPQAVSRSNGIKQRWNTHPQLSSSYMSHASSSPTFNAYGGETYAPTTGDEGMTLIHTPPNFGSAGPQREYGSPKAMQVDPSFTGLGLDIYNPYQKPSFPYRQPASRKHMATSGLANEVRHQGIEADDDADMEATMTATHGARPLEDFEGLDGLWLNGMMVDHDPMEAL